MTGFGLFSFYRRGLGSKTSSEKMSNRTSKTQDGFTLVECLIAMLILSVALLGMAAFMGSLMKANLKSKQTQTASTTMEAKMEELRNIPSSLLTNGNDTVSEGNTTYTRTWTVGFVGGNLYTVNMKVDIGSTGKTVTADTLRN